jgi:glutamine synthetase
MPKPLFNEAGSGMHFHQRLMKGSKNLFWDPKGYGGLSKLALHYVAGLLAHAPALLAFTNPSTNSYKRLVPGFEAPVKTIFGLANRSAAVRIPKYADTAATKRIEFRPPDATCNVYLAMAAQLMAGLDGIRRQLDPTRLGFGPYDVNVFKLPEAEKAKLGSLPTSLREAMLAGRTRTSARGRRLQPRADRGLDPGQDRGRYNAVRTGRTLTRSPSTPERRPCSSTTPSTASSS